MSIVLKSSMNTLKVLFLNLQWVLWPNAWQRTENSMSSRSSRANKQIDIFIYYTSRKHEIYKQINTIHQQQYKYCDICLSL